ncbi:MAG: tRNA uridine-5-carboxymethylaminomethyl(34) synthesis GTPase MnmE [SAR86 cluster bacterium]|uniref:tRNA modification GTPase MnmE n=1 Tax=SAR86 cluster bacterium TaxID=2030880 RepID=A0A937HW32_9GAMM|nr:tRNA uridine-5-carboxymethylaminomethyl(34) synthesis GTPase MnmE [SAR86 cluster bacterium]
MLSKNETIVACSSPPGRGAISTIRLSGNKAISIIQKITNNKLKKQISVVKFPLDVDLIEKCVLTIFRSPHSYTGEDLIEISTHGNPYIVERVIEKCLNSGAKVAKPGEFTLRAFLNNKLSLDQSEAVIEIINANSRASLKASQNSLEGGLKVKISKIQEKLRDTRVLVETLIDFADEDVDIYIDEVISKIDEFKKFYKKFNEDMKAYNSITNDVKVVVIGPPNSGKSTLINAIIGKKVSIVHEKQGTTRDVVTSSCLIDGIRFVFSDTAGIRKTSDQIEEEGIKLSKKALKSADIVIYMVDKEKDFYKLPIIKSKKNIFVLNKIDLCNKKAPEGGFAISAKTKKNLSLLKKALTHNFLKLNQEELLSVNFRHLDLIKKAYKSIALISPGLVSSNLELVAENLRKCDEFLGEIYDPISSDEMLGKIFDKFCIGK